MKFIFDFDGTLVDSMPYWGEKMIQVLEQMGVAPPKELIKIITPLGYVGTAKYYIEHFQIMLSEEEIIEKMKAAVAQQYRDVIPAKDTVVETLRTLKKMGHSLNVLTASPHVMLDCCLKRIGIYELFDHVWSCEDFSTTKADPNIYYMAAQRLNTTAENCVFLDDNLNALSTAKQTGMKLVGVHDHSADEDREKIMLLCDKYIEKMDELIRT